MLDQDVHMDIRAHLFNYRIATTMQPKEKEAVHLFNYRIATTMQPKEKEAEQEMSTCFWGRRPSKSCTSI